MPNKADELMATWLEFTLKASGRHAAACDHYDRLDSALGLTSAALAAVVGSTVFVSLQQNTSTTLKIGASILGVTAAVLSGIQTTMKFGSRSERHRQASRHYGALVRQIEEFQALPSAHADVESRFDEIRKTLDDVGSAAPDVPPKIWGRKLPTRPSSAGRS